MPLFLIWSEEHGAWWRPHERGYTTKISEAGIYTAELAARIVRSANAMGFNEFAIPFPAGLDMVNRNAG